MNYVPLIKTFLNYDEDICPLISFFLQETLLEKKMKFLIRRQGYFQQIYLDKALKVK